MKAVILCAGLGTRMKPYTDRYQKTMLPIHGKPLLEYIIDGIKFAGIKDFILIVGYLKSQIIDYFQDGQNFGVSIEYVEQKKLDGTGGALLLCEDLINEDHFFLCWGDILVPYTVYKKVYHTYLNDSEDFILVTNFLNYLSKGCAIYTEGNYCIKLIEKPKPRMQTTNLNNCGIFILSRKIFHILKVLEPSDRGELEIPDAIQKGIKSEHWKVRIIKMESDQFRGDFGDIHEYEYLKSNKDWLKRLR